MNANFTAWTNEKEDNSADPTEEQIDPTFARHQDTDFPTVEDVTAAAVANAQQQNQHQQAHLATTGHNLHQVHHQQQQHDEHVRAAQAAAELQHVQQHAQRHQHHQIVAAAAAAAGVGSISDSKKQANRLERPVSTTKRAAQNRNAQRAFRQRKEKYIKDLEQQAAEVNQLKQTIEELRSENLQLRDYTLALQSRVIELSPPNTHHQLASANATQLGPGNSENVPTPPAAVFNNNNKMFQPDK